MHGAKLYTWCLAYSMGSVKTAAAAKSLQLCLTQSTGSPSLGFSRQEHWSGLPCPSPVHESESEVASRVPTVSHPRACSLAGSSVHGIFQARVLEWGATAAVITVSFRISRSYLYAIACILKMLSPQIFFVECWQQNRC